MKYLKLFEDVDDTDEYYKKVSTLEFQNRVYGPNIGGSGESMFIKDNWDKLTSDEISLIENTFKTKDRKYECKLAGIGFLQVVYNAGTPNPFLGISYKWKNDIKPVCRITKLNDEWYGIQSTKSTKSHDSYICDQFDGLLKCIEDKILMKI